MLRETLSALQLKVTIGDDEQVVKLKPGDLVRYEEHFGKSLVDGVSLDDEGNPTGMAFGITELTFLAYLGAKRAQMFDGTYDEFLDVMDDVDIESDDPASLGKDPSPA